MRHFIIALMLLETAVRAQDTPRIDLSGEWRRSTDDRPEYAQPDFDDRAWEKVRLPWTLPPPMGRYWLRRTVDAPPGFRPQTFVTLGPVAEDYEVFINGQPVGSVGSVDGVPSPVARSRTHALPSSTLTPRLHVALRVRRAGINPSTFLYLGGTYAVTGSAPVLAEENHLLFLRQRARHSTSLVIITLLISCAAFLWLLWFTERRRTELAWLGLVAASRGFVQMGLYLSIAPDGYVNATIWGRQAHCVSGAALAELILAFVGFRCAWWLRVLIWSCWWLPLNLNSELRIYLYGLLDLGALAILAFGRWRQRQPDSLTTIAVALVTLAHLNTNWRYFSSIIEWNGYDINVTSGSPAVLSALLVVLSLRSLTADRRERQRLATELEAARTVQQLLLPLTEARGGIFEANAVYEPAQEVGGDFHWNRVTPDGALIVVVGDVSGKGLKAAMLVSVVIGILRT